MPTQFGELFREMAYTFDKMNIDDVIDHFRALNENIQRSEPEICSYIIDIVSREYGITPETLVNSRDRKAGKRFMALAVTSSIMSDIAGLTYKEIGIYINKRKSGVTNYMVFINKIVDTIREGGHLSDEEQKIFDTLKKLYIKAENYKKMLTDART